MPIGPETPLPGGGGPASSSTGDQRFEAHLSTHSTLGGPPAADPTNAFLINQTGVNLINNILGRNLKGSQDINVINNINDNPTGVAQGTIGGGEIGLDQLNYFDNKGPMQPRTAFMNAVSNWSFNIPQQNLWAIVFDLPPALKGLNASGNSRIDDLLHNMGEFNRSAGRDMNARHAVSHLSQDHFQRSVGCLFAQSVTIPGESIQMNWLSPHEQSSGGLVGFPTFGNRQQFASLTVGFRETNLSFIDFVMRPWLVLAAHLGLTERLPAEGLGIKTDIHIIQFGKAGAALKPGTPSGPGAFHQNVIPLIPRKIWRFKDCTPIRVPQGDYNYSEALIESRSIEFIYNHYEVRAPINYINAAEEVSDTVDDILPRHRPDSARRFAESMAGNTFANFERNGDSSSWVPVGGRKYENMKRKHLRKPEDKNKETVHASNQKSFGEARRSPLGPVGDKNKETVHASNQKSFGEARKGRLGSVEDTNTETVHSSNQKAYGDNKQVERHGAVNNLNKYTVHAENQKSFGDAKKGRLGAVEDTNTETVHASNQKSFGDAKQGRSGSVQDTNTETVHASNQKSFGEAKKGRPGAVGDTNKHTVHASNQKSFGEAVPQPDATPERMKSDMHFQEGKNKKMPSPGGYRWNSGSRGLFGWL